MNAVATASRASILAKMANKFSVDPNVLQKTLSDTVFRGATQEQTVALLVVADQYGLNPFTKEIYAFPAKGGGIVPVVGIDGWLRIINEHPQFDGMEFEQDEVSCTCKIYRKDRRVPTSVTEYLTECKRNTDPWNSHPSRMLRHKATIQCARVAFGFAGIKDPDEAERIIEAEVVETVSAKKPHVATPQRKQVIAPAETIQLPVDELLAYAAGKGMTREDVESVLSAELSISYIDAITEDILDPCKDAIDAAAEASA